MFLVTDLPPVPAYEMVLAATPTPASGLVLASTAAHLKTIKQCPAHQHFVMGICTPYKGSLMMMTMWPASATPAKTS
jgi:hypothetical protein